MAKFEVFLSLGHFIKHKHLISEECPLYMSIFRVVYFGTNLNQCAIVIKVLTIYFFLFFCLVVGSQQDMIVNVWDWHNNIKVASNKISTKVKAISFAENGNYFVVTGNNIVFPKNSSNHIFAFWQTFLNVAEASD